MRKKFLNKTYLLLLIPSFLIVTFAWSFFVNGKLYYCSDPFPIVDFIPPFVHKSVLGDYYIAPEWVVYLVWFFALVTIFLLPLLFVKFKDGLKKERLEQKVVKSKKKK